MAAAARDRRRRGRALGAASAAAAEDDGEEHHLNPFLSDAAPTSSRVQFRNVASRARWVEEAGAAEVLDNKGKLWLTTGVTRGGRLYYNVEEIGFLAERGALIFLDDEGATIGMEEIYGKIAGGKYGCSWDAFQAYKHLKLLGYIIGRYGVPWTMKHSPTCETTDSLEGMPDTDQSFNRANGVRNGITKLLGEMHIDGLHPSFEVYLPNNKFRKSSPGAPCFLLSMLSGYNVFPTPCRSREWPGRSPRPSPPPPLTSPLPSPAAARGRRRAKPVRACGGGGGFLPSPRNIRSARNGWPRGGVSGWRRPGGGSEGRRRCSAPPGGNLGARLGRVRDGARIWRGFGRARDGRVVLLRWGTPGQRPRSGLPVAWAWTAYGRAAAPGSGCARGVRIDSRARRRQAYVGRGNQPGVAGAAPEREVCCGRWTCSSALLLRLRLRSGSGVSCFFGLVLLFAMWCWLLRWWWLRWCCGGGRRLRPRGGAVLVAVDRGIPWPE
ncbi:uncharacterized protein [Triticum aestivum]|uniref:uncharacterized protein isoform X1 n=1 Tax=Triticum aestivum TaxID=4565 RepID=UPI001D03495D|nr:uncharacterized protein LOC123112542 isoform X1 [Triticum aestivum]